MSERPYMPLYTADYRDATAHLSAAQHGAYLLLLMSYWSKGSLPKDERLLSRIACMSDREWKANRDVIAAFFDADWKHARVEKELLRAREKSEARAASGSRGGTAKALNNKNAVVAKATILPEQKPSKSLPSSSYTGTDKKEEGPSVPRREREAIDLESALEAYNRTAGLAGWPKAISLNEARKGKLRSRLQQVGGLAGWVAAVERAAVSAHLTGNNDRGWRADLDFFLTENKFTKLLEGSYDNRKPSGSAGANGLNSAFDRLGADIARRKNHDWRVDDELPFAAGGGLPKTSSGYG